MSKEEMFTWTRLNRWMIFFWLAHAERTISSRDTQVFAQTYYIELDPTNRLLRKDSPLFSPLMNDMFNHIVFGEKSEKPFSFDGYYTKYGELPKVGDIQLYYTSVNQIEEQRHKTTFCKQQLKITFRWERINGGD